MQIFLVYSYRFSRYPEDNKYTRKIEDKVSAQNLRWIYLRPHNPVDFLLCSGILNGIPKSHRTNSFINLILLWILLSLACTIASKINGTPKGVYLPISKLHSMLAVANLLAHNNKSQICYCGQISLQSAAVNCSFPDNLTPLEVTFILLAMVHLTNSDLRTRLWYGRV